MTQAGKLPRTAVFTTTRVILLEQHALSAVHHQEMHLKISGSHQTNLLWGDEGIFWPNGQRLFWSSH